jgi:hypothetical protein
LHQLLQQRITTQTHALHKTDEEDAVKIKNQKTWPNCENNQKMQRARLTC